MIISDIIGGLGNQMFQYAAGRALSIRTSQTLTLDTNSFKRYPLHNGFELQRVFNVPAQVASRSDIAKVIGWLPATGVELGLSSKYWRPIAGTSFVGEPSFSYWRGIIGLADSCYLSGYWQSEKYFMEYADQIRKDFSFNDALTEDNQKIYGAISKSCSVSCHIRRGDYVTNLKANQIHGVCSLEYYEKAIKFMQSNLIEPIFYIFSDDQEWVRKNLTFPKGSIFVDGNYGCYGFQDMQLMSLCQHHIIANSSFSWWGAWLNPSESKIVIAPRRWFSADIDDGDLIPAKWIRI